MPQTLIRNVLINRLYSQNDLFHLWDPKNHFHLWHPVISNKELANTILQKICTVTEFELATIRIECDDVTCQLTFCPLGPCGPGGPGVIRHCTL